MDAVAIGAEGEARRNAWIWIKLRLVKGDVPARSNAGSVWNSIFFRRIEIIGQEPPANISRRRRWIVEFDRIGGWREIGASQSFIDEHGRDRRRRRIIQ